LFLIISICEEFVSKIIWVSSTESVPARARRKGQNTQIPAEHPDSGRTPRTSQNTQYPAEHSEPVRTSRIDQNIQNRSEHPVPVRIPRTPTQNPLEHPEPVRAGQNKSEPARTRRTVQHALKF
jgi:hypothetical protein